LWLVTENESWDGLSQTVLYKEGKYEDARRTGTKALELAEKSFPPDLRIAASLSPGRGE
jgi:hypothetical protein